MANPEHLAKLKEGVGAWNARRREETNVRPDLSGADLSDADLSDADLSDADLSDANLDDANLAAADLRDANLSDAHLLRARLDDTNLCGANLAGADLHGADLRGADLRGASLGGANLSSANLSGANLCFANLGRAILCYANLRGASLDGARLYGAHLEGAHLSGASLDGAHLKGAHLEGAHLEGAHLSAADLRGASLDGARLSGADLSGANLCESILSDANFSRADLSGAHLKGALLGGVVFFDCNLSGAKGMSEVAHVGPSAVDTRTLAKLFRGHSERAGILDLLRGCGLPEWEIIHARMHTPGLSANEIQEIAYDAALVRIGRKPIQIVPFISYSHQDKTFATKLHDALQAKGVRCWRDERSLLPGQKLSRRINEAINVSDRMILIASANSLGSQWVHDEILAARKRGGLEEYLIPLDLDGELFRRDDLPHVEWIRDHVAAKFRKNMSDAKFDEGVELLVRALRASGEG